MKHRYERILMAFWFVGLVLIVFSASDGRAGESNSEIKPLLAPPSDWVKPQFYNRQSLAAPIELGVDQRWLLLERQVNVGTNESFFHCARQILNLAGVQNGSTLKVDLNPAYQKLVFHWARIWRGTNFLNRLDPEKIRVVRQERDLEQQILNGEQSAMLVMDDVRVGDVVDYAYSVKGVNPVFEDKFSISFQMQFEDPVDRLLTRVIWPAQRRLYPKAFNFSSQPLIKSTNGTIECVWDFQRVPSFKREDMMPVWCDPEPWVQLTEFKNWSDVSQWASGLFQASNSLSPELLQKISEWRKLADKEQQVLAALRFVQEDIRYFGIEIGISANKPADPATVFSRRYGDCKDKSLLFTTILRTMGFEAYPVLVNTEARQTIESWLPAAGIFDHCIAVVRFGGNNWWLDPTATYQRGPLASHYLPKYGCGLVVSPGTTGLTSIPQNTGMPLTITTEYFELGKKSGVSELNVVTVAEGRDAESLRETFANTKLSEIEKKYTHFYEEFYPGTKLASPIEVVDDQAKNQFKITEHYAIDQAWVKSESDGKYRCDFYAASIGIFNKKPVDVKRRQPLAVPYPQHQILKTEITVPVGWTYKKENISVIDPAFVFKKQSKKNGRTLILEYEFQTILESVPAGRTPDYLQNIGIMAKNLWDGFVWK